MLLMRIRRAWLLVAIATTAISAEAEAQVQQELDRKAIQEIVREYLISNPEVLEEAMRALRAKREAARRKVVRTMIGRNRAAMSPVSGNPKGDVTLVEFFWQRITVMGLAYPDSGWILVLFLSCR